MARVSKVLVRRGIHQAPQGEFRATPARLAAYADKFARMKALGIKVPVAWGHQPAALPGDARDRAAQQYHLSAYNAGYLDELTYNRLTGELESKLDAPGCELDASGNLCCWTRLPDGREVKTAIGEVSIAVKDWTDGQGRKWPDSIVHVALTPLPVVAGQTGFAAALGTATDDTGTFYLSLTTLSREEHMADDFEDRDEEGGEAETGDEQPDEELDDEAPAEDEPPAKKPPAEGGDKGARVNEAIRCLAAYGIHLPPDTTLDSLAERICVACHGKAEGKQAENEDTSELPDDEDEEMPAEEGETYSGPNEGGQTQEEQRPVLMSLTTAQTDTERKLIGREQERHKKQQLRLIDQLVKRGMPVARAEEYRQRLDGYTLSLTQAGDVQPKLVDRELSCWNEALPRKGFKTLLAGSGSGRQEPRPDERRGRADLQAQEAAGDELAALAGHPVRKAKK